MEWCREPVIHKGRTILPAFRAPPHKTNLASTVLATQIRRDNEDTVTESGRARNTGATNALSPADGLFGGPGEMRLLCRERDWAATPFGPVAHWPVSLRVTVATMLASRHPMFLFWGPDLAQIFNDAYRPSFGEGGRHLRALGARGQAFWTEIWHIIGPQIAQIIAGGEATWHEDQLVPIERNGRIENVWWTYGYSPAFDDDGQVSGVLVVCQETTRRVLDSQEREQLLAKVFSPMRWP